MPEALQNWEPPAGANLSDAFIEALKANLEMFAGLM